MNVTNDLHAVLGKELSLSVLTLVWLPVSATHFRGLEESGLKKVNLAITSIRTYGFMDNFLANICSDII